MVLLAITNPTKTEYKPREKAREWLKSAMDYIQSVDYKVSARWVSYRLLQDGLIKSKDEFKKLDYYMSRARKAEYENWTRFTLADSIREPINEHYPGTGNPNDKDPESIAYEHLQEMNEIFVSISRWWYENYYVEVWYEARAMTEQFKRYVPYGVTLQPCGGDISIPMKAEGAKRIGRWSKKLGKPAVVLYFGDLDDKGKQIPQSFANDVLTWCDAPLNIYRVGLMPEHKDKFNLPENPDKPGNFQWEALSDTQAAELIREGIRDFITQEAEQRAEEEAENIAKEAMVHFRRLLDENL